MIIKIHSGLGNQMFQYAFGRAASLRLRCDLFLDTASFGHMAPGDTPRSYELNVFNIQARIADEKNIKKYHTTWYLFLKKLENKLNPEKFHMFEEKRIPKTCDSYSAGFWQTEKYFVDIADTIRKDFTLAQPFSPESAKMESVITSSNNSVSLHIRRGDYVTNTSTTKHHGICSLSYYEEGLKLLREKLGTFSLFVFSDDIAWAEQNTPSITPPGIAVIYVSKGSIPDYEELILMSHCSHHIIANSSYSWWGAWLNPKSNKVVIGPKKWLANETVDTRDVLPATWIRI